MTLFVAGCTAFGTTTIDTWPVGNVMDCSDDRCSAMIATGLAALDIRDPGHAPVESSVMHLLGPCVDPKTGEKLIANFGGGSTNVLVVEEADGSRHAIGVGYPGISQTPMAFDRWTCPGSG